MISSAVDFVLSKIDRSVGTRSKSINADIQYELPVEAVTEAIVNAVAHRDYTSNASVQVMLFPDRLEILNPGKLPVGLTIEELYYAHRSIPANPLIADTLYFNGTIDKVGTGTGDIVELCMQMGLKQPKFKQGSGFEAILYRKNFSNHPIDQAAIQVTPQVAPQVTPQVKKLLSVLNKELSTVEIQKVLELSDRKNIRDEYIVPAIILELVEPLYPDKPSHPQQKYRLTQKGKLYLDNN